MRLLPLVPVTVFCVGGGLLFGADGERPVKPSSISVSMLEDQAQRRVGTKARIDLAPETSEAFRDVEPVLASDKGRIPNYARAVAPLKGTPGAFSQLVYTFLYAGSVEPETKMAMALRMSQLNGSPYAAAHVIRLLRTTSRGKTLLAALKSNSVSTLPEADQRALAYADAATREVHGLNDAEFQKVRALYNDSQIVELTFTVCLFNYFTRFVEALNLPVEPWALETPAPSAAKWTPDPARVSLVSDAEIAFAKGTSVSTVNSQRAMMRVPALAAAFRGFGGGGRDSEAVSREIKLQVSFAVSMANGCRYCTLHQVQGLRRLGVSPSKLVAMKKDDDALTSREKVAVVFARKLTREPSGITDGDYAALRQEFGEQGALEVLMQTCNFAFMNRFTDGLRLPSEDAAIQIYRETYGADFGR